MNVYWNKQKANVLPLIILFFLSCNLLIYTNGKFSHKERGLTSKWQSNNDSCFVIGENDRVPDSVVFINDTKILSPFFWLIGKRPDVIMTNRAEDEAKRVGANIIKIADPYAASKSARYLFQATMYYLKEPYLGAYRRQTDSIKIVNTRFSIVHIRCLAKPTAVYFNDSLFGVCLAPIKRQGGLATPVLHGKFDKAGIISVRLNGTNKYKIGIPVAQGGVYNLLILTGKYGEYIVEE